MMTMSAVFGISIFLAPMTRRWCMTYPAREFLEVHFYADVHPAGIGQSDLGRHGILHSNPDRFEIRNFVWALSACNLPQDHLAQLAANMGFVEKSGTDRLDEIPCLLQGCGARIDKEFCALQRLGRDFLHIRRIRPHSGDMCPGFDSLIRKDRTGGGCRGTDDVSSLESFPGTLRHTNIVQNAFFLDLAGQVLRFLGIRIDKEGSL